MKPIIEILMRYGGDVFALDFKKRTPLHYMFIEKNRRWVSEKVDVVGRGLEEILSKKQSQFIDINHQDINGKTLLHYAAQRGSVQSLNYIIDIKGINNIKFDLLDKSMNTPLGVAINNKHFDFVEKLVQLEKIDLKGFIYDEVIKRREQQQNVLQQQQENEDSDLEFADVQQNNGFNKDQKQVKHNKDEALNYFRFIIRNNYQQLENSFIQNYQDRIQMVIDYICEGKINKLFNIIETKFNNIQNAKQQILLQKNEKQQNLIHVLCRNSHLIQNINEIIQFYNQLIQEGVKVDEYDYKGRSALHLAIKSGNFEWIKYLLEEVRRFDVNTQDKRRRNAIATLIKGDRIVRANPQILNYLIEKFTININELYQENLYKDNKYMCSPLIHSIRHEAKDRQNIQQILKILIKRSEFSTQDSQKRDSFMYIAMRNHMNTFKFILQEIGQSNYKNLKNNNQDLKGKTFAHYIVSPLEYGSYENKQMLQKAFEMGFDMNMKDNKNQTPYQYACKQQSGQLKQIFEQQLNLQEEINDQMQIEDLIDPQPNQIDFELDAQKYLEDIQMQECEMGKFIPCDPLGQFNDDCEVVFDDNLQQYFDVYLTRVDIGHFQPGGDYLFYKIQLVLDKSRNLPILLTRWGRIGEEGAYQKTPFNTTQEAINEFKKIFEQKTNNQWKEFDKFQKAWRKFQLMKSNYVTIDQKNYLSDFKNIPESPQIEQIGQNNYKNKLNDIMKEICDVDTYLKALNNSGIDIKAMPFSNINRSNLYQALDKLQQLEKTIKEIEKMNPRPYSENERNKLLATREKIWYLSSNFYEYIPHLEFRNKMVPPIRNLDQLLQKAQMLLNLIEIEMASKILLGAHYRLNKYQINPYQYCLQATGVEMNILDQESSEFKLIYNYIQNTSNQGEENKIKNIIKLNKESENKMFKFDIHNRRLLFHGTKISNYLSILSQGLRVQPMQAQRQGNLLGRGIYFSDMFSKAYQYTPDQNAHSYSSRFVLLCEVALGNQKVFNRPDNRYDLLDIMEEGKEDINSILGQGRQRPEQEKFVILPDGAQIPYGKVEQAGDYGFQFNEFVIPRSSQTRFRYLIQLT